MTSSSEIENYQNMSIFPSKKNDKAFFSCYLLEDL